MAEIHIINITPKSRILPALILWGKEALIPECIKNIVCELSGKKTMEIKDLCFGKLLGEYGSIVRDMKGECVDINWFGIWCIFKTVLADFIKEAEGIVKTDKRNRDYKHKKPIKSAHYGSISIGSIASINHFVRGLCIQANWTYISLQGRQQHNDDTSFVYLPETEDASIGNIRSALNKLKIGFKEPNLIVAGHNKNLPQNCDYYLVFSLLASTKTSNCIVRLDSNTITAKTISILHLFVNCFESTHIVNIGYCLYCVGINCLSNLSASYAKTILIGLQNISESELLYDLSSNETSIETTQQICDSLHSLKDPVGSEEEWISKIKLSEMDIRLRLFYPRTEIPDAFQSVKNSRI